jgi:hypothetical protein
MAPTVGRQGICTKELSVVIISRKIMRACLVINRTKRGEELYRVVCRFLGGGNAMTPVTEFEVAVAASYMGYDLIKLPDGYVLKRDWNPHDPDIVVADTLERIADFLKH